MKRVLFLDDNYERGIAFLEIFADAKVVWVETAAEAIEMLAQPWDLVMLDHDLGGEVFVSSSRDDSGMAVVRWIEANRPTTTKRIHIHSWNIPAAREMTARLRDCGGYKITQGPFVKETMQSLRRLINDYRPAN
jgi:CheY-like chemotaxis protein